jgi:small subunit ribosomal protein S16
MVTIRLQRSGAKKKPFFHLVVTSGSSPRDGRFIERLGYLNPVARGEDVRMKVDLERVDAWLAHGAQPSERARSMIEKARKGAAAESASV